MIRIRRWAAVICLAILATSVSAKALTESDKISRGRVAQDSVPGRGTPKNLDPTVPEQSTPFISKPVDKARRVAASISFLELSGGPTGTLLAVAALLTGLAILLAAFVPW